MQKVILITGGSRGIGAATAMLAAEKGYAVVVNYLRSEEAAHEIVNNINKQGRKAIAIRADVSVENAVIDLFKRIDAELGSVDVLVNNAGILETQMRVDEMDAARINRIMTANVLSCFLCSKEAIRRMSTKYGGRGGSIINVSSVAARTGSPNEYVDYAASKGAVDSFTLGLAKEVAAEGIRVNGVRPGFIYTDIHASGGEPGRVDRLRDSIPMKRGGYPSEIAEAIVWLASEGASYTSGTFIDAAGGR
ncbi:SDR family oxidoreductase [Pollutibacter soli]|uniref:SDR family oxidoreductase n=1 Tax=Pollutibacter soli TaxID=3034157 RepID=UPI003013B79A